MTPMGVEQFHALCVPGGNSRSYGGILVSNIDTATTSPSSHSFGMAFGKLFHFVDTVRHVLVPFEPCAL
jgi:hypothetical protein